DTVGVYIETDNAKALLDESAHQRQADIAKADDADYRGPLLDALEQRLLGRHPRVFSNTPTQPLIVPMKRALKRKAAPARKSNAISNQCELSGRERARA